MESPGSLIGYDADCGQKTCEVTRYTPLSTLHQKKLRLSSQLSDVEAAIAALEKNPELTNILDLLSKVLR